MTAVSASCVAAKKADKMVATYVSCGSQGALLQGCVGCVKHSVAILPPISTLMAHMEDQVAKGSIAREKLYQLGVTRRLKGTKSKDNPIDDSSIADGTDCGNNRDGTEKHFFDFR